MFLENWLWKESDFQREGYQQEFFLLFLVFFCEDDIVPSF
jgi:hypothetical protein